MRRTPLLLTFALFGAGCTPAKPATVIPEPAPPATESAGEGTAARIEPSCRALVNFDDGTFLDVKLEDGKVRATRRAGTALYDQAAVYIAVVESRGADDWVGEDLMRVGPDGKAELWSSNDPGERPGQEEFCDLVDPDDPDSEEECWMDPEDFYAEHSLEVVGAFGPYLSVAAEAHGFSGGAHEYDDGYYATLALPGIEPLEGKHLGAPHVALVRKILAEEVVDEELTADALPTFQSPEDFGDFAVVLGPREAYNVATSAEGLAGEDPEDLEFRPHLLTRIEAGDWAMNHGYIDLALDLTPVPAAIASYLPEHGRWVGPNDCAAVSVPERAVLLPDGERWVPMHELEGEIIGVTWLAPEQARVPGLDDLRG